MKIMLYRIRLLWMKFLIWIMEKAVAVHFFSVHQHRRNFGVPKSSPRGPQWSQVFCPTRQKTLPSRNRRSQVKAMSTWWDRKTGHLRYTSGIPEGGVFHFQCGRRPLFVNDWWLLRKAHVTEPLPACSPAVSTASQSSDIFTLLVSGNVNS